MLMYVSGGFVSSRTRRLVFLTALIVAVMLPAETILLRALVTPTQEMAVQGWVSGLDDNQLSRVSGQLSSYPLLYRREVMKRLDGRGRSAVWRNHLVNYLSAHPELDSSAVALVKTAMSLLSPTALAKPSRDDAAAMQSVAEQLIAAIGREDTEFLLFRLGPPDGTFASAEPTALRLENTVRGWFIASAFFGECECSMNAGCFSWVESCSQAQGCQFVDTWPACGWGWYQDCDGMCVAD